MELENLGSALGTVDHARRRLQHGHDVPALDFFQGSDLDRRHGASDLSSQLVGFRSVCASQRARSEEHTSELQSRPHLVCRLLLEKKKKHTNCCCIDISRT